MAKIDAFFNLMFEQKASDLHMASGNPPMLRINGELQRVDYPPLESDSLKTMLYEIAPDYKIKLFEESGDVDFGYEIPKISRFRVNFFNQKNGIGAVFRQIPSRVLSFEDFEKFEAPLPAVLKKFCMLNRGLVVVTGPTGSGKSTTLAAMVDYCNKNRKDHIITVEDPIEFVHESKNSLINHREVGIHTKSFAAALRGALREDPDIILVGEMRDLETIELASQPNRRTGMASSSSFENRMPLTVLPPVLRFKSSKPSNHWTCGENACKASRCHSCRRDEGSIMPY